MRAPTRVSLVVCFSVVSAHVARAQIRPETIRGRITSDSGIAIRGASIAATMAPDRLTFTATTDSAGTYAIRFERGTGDYLVYVGAAGYRPFRKRITRQPTDTSLTVSAALAPIVAQLTTVNVSARKLVPRRGDDPAGDVGAADQQREGVYASLTPDQEGSLAAIALAIPGASAQPDGLSVLGLGGAQSSVTLNGMSFSGASLPRDAQSTVTVAMSPYDPARGGFSAGQTNVQLSSGHEYFQRRGHLTVDAPPLQTTDALGDRFGARYTNVVGSIGGSGPVRNARYLYNNAFQVSRRQSDAATLLGVGADALSAAGIAPDSVERLHALLAALRVPIAGSGIPSSVVSDNVAFSTRIDRSPYLPNSFVSAPTTWNVALVGNVTNEHAVSLMPENEPTRGGSRRTIALTGQADYSHFFGDVLNDARLAYSANDTHSAPFLRAPGGDVIVSSALADGSDVLTSAGFGGDALLDYHRRSWTLEAINETQWYAKGRPHRVKVTVESRLDGYSQSAQDNLLGTFTFPSLGALASSQPSSFSRTLSAPSREGGVWSGFLSASDYWRVSRSLQFLVGARVEGNHFTTSLTENAAVSSLFGETTRLAPDRLHVSPRAGFTWYFGPGAGIRGNAFTPYSTQTLAPVAMLRGGIGEFRGFLAPSLLADANASNGLPGSTSRLLCLGSATPTPQWSSYAADLRTVPAACAGGAPSVFSDGASSVRVFDRAYDAPRSWRANLTLERALGPVSVSLDGVYSINLNQPGSVDVNFSGVSKFTLSDEGRSVFASSSSIVPGTGVVSAVDARASAAFGRVVRYQSDLRSISRQLTASVAPRETHPLIYGLTYTLGDMRANARGFDGAAFAAPSAVEWAPGALDIRHQIQAYVGTALPHRMHVALFGRFMSGRPYTPLVSSDVNGDGLANDRAFVFDPGNVPDLTVAASMRALLASAPAQASECLRAQYGQAAARNSCRGPWTAYVNARLGVVNLSGWTRRAFSASLNVSNPLAGVDALLHGTDHMQGWGAPGFPDPTLLTVRGFDPVTNRFLYVVNPRFGSTRLSQQTNRAPFRVTLDMAFDLGVPVIKQQAIKLLSPGRRGNREPRMTTDSIITKLTRQVPDIYGEILEESDSLLISREQTDALKSAQVGYRARMAEHWKETAAAFAAMDDDFDADRGMHMLDDAIGAGWLISRDELPVIERVLTPLQVRLGPRALGWLKQSVGQKYVGFRIGASF
ncbi:MAG: carboxypeptidase-like regulatory domain-containing protein [bacterium]